jgi:hypothetical protein
VRKEQALQLACRITEITGIDVPIIVGSQSVFAITDDAPELIKRSVECGFLLGTAGADAIRKVIDQVGFASKFQEETGLYADALGLATVVLPTGWRERLLSLMGDDGKVSALCLEPHDACVSKLMAGREKDFEFIAELLRRELITIDTLVDRAALVGSMPQSGALLLRLEKLEQVLRESRVKCDLDPLDRLTRRLR